MGVDPVEARAALDDERRETYERQQRLVADLRDVMSAARDVATDDEHDPEGATIAYERARIAALLRQAEEHVVEIDAALERLDAGTYGRCQRCGGEIAAARLLARPVSRTCIVCANR